MLRLNASFFNEIKLNFVLTSRVCLYNYDSMNCPDCQPLHFPSSKVNLDTFKFILIYIHQFFYCLILHFLFYLSRNRCTYLRSPGQQDLIYRIETLSVYLTVAWHDGGADGVGVGLDIRRRGRWDVSTFVAGNTRRQFHQVFEETSDRLACFARRMGRNIVWT